MSETLEIVCERTGRPLGERLPRPEALARRAWCRSTNVFVLNAEGKVLCHQRSAQKERHPGAWSTHLGGHVCGDETYETNALKEAEEEAGIRADAVHMLAWRTTRLTPARLWVREFVLLHDVPVESLVPQPGEVERFAWLSPEEILRRKAERPDEWLAGTHDFGIEYYCMRAALNAAHAAGVLSVPEALHAWHPAEAV